MKDFFIDKFNYNHECNKRFITLMVTSPEGYSPLAERWMSHILNAQDIWNHRLEKKEFAKSYWPTFPLEQLNAINDNFHSQSVALIRKTDLKAHISFRNSKGEVHNRFAEDILFHIVNHSTYHRGQLILELKKNGLTPISTDFTFIMDR